MKTITMDITGLDKSEISVLTKAVRKIKRKSKEELVYKVKNGQKTVNDSNGLDKSSNYNKDQYNNMNNLKVGHEVRTFLPDSPHSQVEVRFGMLGHDWKLLEESKEWKAFSNLLLEYQIKNNQTYRNKGLGLSEN